MRNLIVAILLFFTIGCVSLCTGQTSHMGDMYSQYYVPLTTITEKTCEICGSKYTIYKSNYQFEYDTLVPATATVSEDSCGIDLCDSCKARYLKEYSDSKASIDKTYQAELKEYKEEFLKKCKKKEQANIAERVRNEKAERLRDIIKNKEIETAKENLEKLTREKESIEKEGIKPAPDRYLRIDGFIMSTATLRADKINTSSSTHTEEKK